MLAAAVQPQHLWWLQVYIESILALQRSSGAGKPLQLAIMTSDDTHDRTQALLSDNGYFGASRDQVTLLKQEKARLAC